MTMSIAFYDCPNCIDDFAFDWEKIKKLAIGWRVRVLCPGCQKVVEVVMQGYTLIHNCKPEEYRWAKIVEILPPDPKSPPGFNLGLHMEIHRKKARTLVTAKERAT